MLFFQAGVKRGRADLKLAGRLTNVSADSTHRRGHVACDDVMERPDVPFARWQSRARPFDDLRARFEQQIFAADFFSAQSQQRAFQNVARLRMRTTFRR